MTHNDRRVPSEEHFSVSRESGGNLEKGSVHNHMRLLCLLIADLSLWMDVTCSYANEVVIMYYFLQGKTSFRIEGKKTYFGMTRLAWFSTRMKMCLLINSIYSVWFPAAWLLVKSTMQISSKHKSRTLSRKFFVIISRQPIFSPSHFFKPFDGILPKSTMRTFVHL